MDTQAIIKQIEAQGFKAQPPISGIFVTIHKKRERRFLVYQEANHSLSLHEELNLGDFGRQFINPQYFELVIVPLGNGDCAISLKSRINSLEAISPLQEILTALMDALARAGKRLP